MRRFVSVVVVRHENDQVKVEEATFHGYQSRETTKLGSESHGWRRPSALSSTE
jgi:hypothetical protein